MKTVILVLFLAAIPPGARVQAPAHFTAQHTIQFRAGTEQERRALITVPVVRELVSEPFEIAREDLNDDGVKEIILIAASSMNCGSGGCAAVVLENRAGKTTLIFQGSLFNPLAVTNEKIGQYRAIAVVDDKGTILSGDKRDTPMFGKQMVYPMKVTETAPAATAPADRTNAPAPQGGNQTGRANAPAASSSSPGSKSRSIHFLEGPLTEVVINGLVGKYGQPGYRHAYGDRGVEQHLVWAWDVNGNRLELNDRHTCVTMGLNGASMKTNGSAEDSRTALQAGCAAVIDQENSITKFETLYLIDHFGISTTTLKTSTFVAEGVARYEDCERKRAANTTVSAEFGDPPAGTKPNPNATAKPAAPCTSEGAR
jgi:hypothetical protein